MDSIELIYVLLRMLHGENGCKVEESSALY